jgi:hypothetical protein
VISDFQWGRNLSISNILKGGTEEFSITIGSKEYKIDKKIYNNFMNRVSNEYVNGKNREI